jgi:GMP synthase-like glutamine amidotransferase
MQLMAMSLGGKVASAEKREYGRTRVSILDREDLFATLEEEPGGGMVCWMSHGDHVEVSSRSGTYAAGKRALAQLRRRHLWLSSILDHEQLH